MKQLENSRYTCICVTKLGQMVKLVEKWSMADLFQKHMDTYISRPMLGHHGLCSSFEVSSNLMEQTNTGDIGSNTTVDISLACIVCVCEQHTVYVKSFKGENFRNSSLKFNM